ncbi:MAG TPA: hypothetical protein DDY32_00995 [Desulfobulbaceae bacterium]|nr:hypothetical protein [Desulfobulbaceae bacterium]
MAGRLYIPNEVKDSIAKHFDKAITKAVDGFWSGNEDEDTLTGALGACLRCRTKTVTAFASNNELPGKWKWSIDYTKFRGRGTNATEKYLGADGIFELTLSHGFRHDRKSVLFQSKTDWTTDVDILKQSLLLSTWREAAFVLNYTEDAYETFSVDEVIKARGKKPEKGLPLQKTLSDHFLECKIGDTELEYDVRWRRLSWRTSAGIRVATQFSIPQRIRIRIQAPGQSPSASYDKIIPTDQVHDHRMQASHREIFQNLLSEEDVQLKKLKRELSLTYHPDLFQNFEDIFKEIAKRRMQEINDAYEYVLR